MTQEDKELLLKDLCARLLYKVICHIEIHHKFTGYVEKGDLPLNSISIKDAKCDFIICWGIDIDYVKPYLRPMSSIAELITAKEWSGLGGINLIDWYNANHIDYRGLIEKGLALEAPKGMYK